MEINQLSQRMQRLMELEGFHSLTPIQQEVIPVALQGKDIIGISNTGTGKTHAFLLPILEQIDVSGMSASVLETVFERAGAALRYRTHPGRG